MKAFTASMIKIPRGSVLALAVLLLVTICVEQAFVFPVLTFMVLFVQQPLLSDTESCGLAGFVGVLCAVAYHLPLAFGVGLVLLVVGLSRTVFQQSHVQARDAALTLLACAVMAAGTHPQVPPLVFGAFFAYFIAIIVLIRLWVSRRSYHAKRTKISS